MEPNTETALPPPPPSMSPSGSKVHFTFFNDRGLRAGWRLLIFAVIVRLLVFVVFGGFRFVVHTFRPDLSGTTNPPPLWIGVGEVAGFLIFVLASFAMSRIERRPAGVYGLPLRVSALTRFATGYVLWGFLPLTVVLVIMRGLGVFYFGKPVLSPGEALQWAVTWGFVFLMVGFSEEYTFRGYALYTLADGIGFWPAAIILALLFGRVHMGNGGETYIGIMGTILFALFSSVTLWRTGNLWLAVGAHAGWDWGQSYFYGVNDSGLQAQGHLFNPPPPQGPVWLSGGTVGPEGSIVVLIVWGVMTLGFLLFWPRARSANLAIEQAPSKIPT